MSEDNVDSENVNDQSAESAEQSARLRGAEIHRNVAVTAITQLPARSFQETLGSRKFLRCKSSTGLPSYFFQVRPSSRL